MKTFKEFIGEDGMAGGAIATGPTNVTSGVAGTGGSAGEPGVYLNKKKKAHNPIILGMGRRKNPK